MGGALHIAARDLRARLRDRTALVVAFVAPLALALVLSLSLGGDDDFTTIFGFVDADGGLAGSAFAEEVLGAPALASTVEVRRYDDADAVRAAVESEEVRAGFVVPTGFSEGVAQGEAVALEVLRSPTSELSGAFAEALAQAFVNRAVVVGRAVRTAEEAGADPATLGAVAQAATEAEAALSLDTVEFAAARVNAASYFGPAMAVFFVFFVVSLGPASLLRERRQGTLARLHAAPIPTVSILLGKALGVFVLALASMGVMWGVTSLALGATWGNPLGVAVMSVAIVLAAAGVTAVIATFGRTDEQVEGWTSIVVFSFALLGGNFAPAEGLPAGLQALSRLTPNGWALQGYVDLSAGAGVSDIVGPLAAVLAFAAVTLVVTVLRAHRLVAP